MSYKNSYCIKMSLKMKGSIGGNLVTMQVQA
jgi:hypothetical protein